MLRASSLKRIASYKLSNVMEMRGAFVFVVVLVVAFGVSVEGQASGLKTDFYKKSCPKVEEIVQDIVWEHVANNSALPAKLLRLYFHDCFVRGCDGSVLLDSTSNDAEKDATPNLSLAGFDVIEEVKTALEKECNRTVSCADIVALAARDSVSFEFQEPQWEVEMGRRDGTVSVKSEALAQIPSPFSNFSTLVQSFNSKNLDVQDLVVLSGAHTIGVGHCLFFSNRLYNFTGIGDMDPSLDPTYAATLKTQCTSQTDAVTIVPMDPETSLSFDTKYFTAMKQNKGLFQSDAALLTNDKSRNLVDKLLDSKNFFDAFKNSIKRMGQIDVLTGSNGEIREKCNVVN